MTHLDEVAVLVRSHGDQHQAVAYLHHSLDEARVTVDEIAEEFGPLIADCVVLLFGDSANRPKGHQQVIHDKLAPIPADDPKSIALVVRVADRLAGVQDCYLKEDSGRMRKFRKDHREFRKAVYRPGLAEELWDELTEFVAW